MGRVLIAYACHIGRPHEIAERLAERLRARGHEVELANARQGPLPPPQDYDAVILGSRFEHGHHAREIEAYVRDWRDVLEDMPTGFFSVSFAAAVPFAGPDPRGHIADLVHKCSWLPDHTACFGRIGTPQPWKLADLVSVSLAELPADELSPLYGPI